MTKQATSADPCPTCAGHGRVFQCPVHELSNGNCCPAGTSQPGCPGKSVPCRDCGGSGRRQGASVPEDQDRVYEALYDKFDLLEGPWPVRPKWWQFSLRARDRYIQKVLLEAGLPELTTAGRIRYYADQGQGFEDAGGYWSRRWCQALGMAYLDPYTNEIHPRSSTVIVFDKPLSGGR